RRASHRGVSEALLDFGDAIVEVAVALHSLTLKRRPRADLTPTSSRGEIRVRLLDGHLFDDALDAHLRLEVLPVKAERSALRCQQLAPLSALVVRVKDE